MDSYMQATALRQRQDVLRQRARFPVEQLMPLVVTDASRRSLPAPKWRPMSWMTLALATCS